MKHLFVDDNSLWSKEGKVHPFIDLSHWEYFKKRIQFWKYKKHRTMGKPILMRWKPKLKGEE